MYALLYETISACHLHIKDFQAFMIIRGEAIMLVKLSIILFSNSHNFTYYSQNYAWFNAHGISDS